MADFHDDESYAEERDDESYAEERDDLTFCPDCRRLGHHSNCPNQ